MALTLKYGSYVFPLSPKVEFRSEPLYPHPQPEAFLVTCTITADLYSSVAQTPALIKALRSSLQSAFATQADLLWMNDTTIIKSMFAATSFGGLTCAVNFPPDGEGTEYATGLPVVVVVTGRYRVEDLDNNTSSFLGSNHCGRYSVTEDLTEVGTIYTVEGELMGADMGLLEVEINTIIQGVTQSSSPIVLARQFVFEYTSDGTPSMAIKFSVQAVNGATSPPVYGLEETIGIQQGDTVTLHPLLGGYDPILQQGPRLGAIVTQRGSALGRSGYPPEVPYAQRRVALPDIERPRIERAFGRRRSDGGYTDFRLSWDYVMVSTQPVSTSSMLPFGSLF